MYCTKKITDDLVWVGANDRRLAMFEGVYSVPRGVSYNSYLLKDELTVLFDTVDKAVSRTFFENVEHELSGRKLDFVVVQHMEPDHSATLSELLLRYPDVKIVANEKILTMITQFFHVDLRNRAFVVKEGDTLNTGNHVLKFIFAPMVHWPEVMVTFDETTGTLFSADAFGTFGALNGAIFADEVDFENEYMDEARRYYCNIVGKYGPQVQSLLKKAHSLDIKMICSLHGFVWRRNLEDIFDKYVKWSTYTPEENGVMIAYASVYGNTENTAEIISSRLRDVEGVPSQFRRSGARRNLIDRQLVPRISEPQPAVRKERFIAAVQPFHRNRSEVEHTPRRIKPHHEARECQRRAGLVFNDKFPHLLLPVGGHLQRAPGPFPNGGIGRILPRHHIGDASGDTPLVEETDPGFPPLPHRALVQKIDLFAEELPFGRGLNDFQRQRIFPVRRLHIGRNFRFHRMSARRIPADPRFLQRSGIGVPPGLRFHPGEHRCGKQQKNQGIFHLSFSY